MALRRAIPTLPSFFLILKDGIVSTGSRGADAAGVAINVLSF
jgi:hypothetical protein